MSSPGGPGYISSPPQTSFHPNLMSTPAPGTGVGFNFPPQSAGYHPALPEIQFSHRHNGLYLYISRILRPVWVSPLLTGTEPTSIVTGTELEFIINKLQSVRLFLEENSNLTAAVTEPSLHHHPPTSALAGPGGHHHPSLPPQLSQNAQRIQQDALLREKQSLLYLRQLVIHSLQVLGLWMVVVDHQVNLVIDHLANDNKNLLRQLGLRELVVTGTGREVCCALVESLIARYLGDSANTDAISNKLREVEPKNIPIE